MTYNELKAYVMGGWYFPMTPEEFKLILTMKRHEDAYGEVWWFNHLETRKN